MRALVQIILRRLALELMRKLDDELKHSTAEDAAFYEHRLQVRACGQAGVCARVGQWECRRAGRQPASLAVASEAPTALDMAHIETSVPLRRRLCDVCSFLCR